MKSKFETVCRIIAVVILFVIAGVALAFALAAGSNRGDTFLALVGVLVWLFACVISVLLMRED